MRSGAIFPDVHIFLKPSFPTRAGTQYHIVQTAVASSLEAGCRDTEYNDFGDGPVLELGHWIRIIVFALHDLS